MRKEMIRAALCMGKIIYWKCRYGSGIKTSPVQGLGRVRIELSPKGKIQLGTRIQNRGELHLICEGEGRLEIGSHVFCNTGVCITSLGHIKIGDCCKLGNNLVVVDHDHNFKNQDEEYSIGEIYIGDRVWIGANCTILKGAHIGDDCVIAAGSVVRGEVPSGMVYYQKRQTELRPIL
ncbi:MAG: acyltransferase [Lachnospiraceae bacterium]|nr:acyltransferase [Lachnospiraceae bacterium]